MLKKMVIPELLQENCTSKKLSIEIDKILIYDK
jgi:lipid A disaccharide synthetase